MAKLVDALDLGSSAARRGGSNPSTRTTEIPFMSDFHPIFRDGLADEDKTESSQMNSAVVFAPILRDIPLNSYLGFGC